MITLLRLRAVEHFNTPDVPCSIVSTERGPAFTAVLFLLSFIVNFRNDVTVALLESARQRKRNTAECENEWAMNRT